eukprot:scaffold6102_cov117-Skeletonema_marinoi.AAC.3
MAFTHHYNTNCQLRRRPSSLLAIIVILLHTPLVWTWTTSDVVSSSISSRVTRQQPKQQRIATLEEIVLPRKDRLTILQESSNESGGEQQTQRRWNRLKFRRRRRDDATQLFASTSDDDGDDVVSDDNEESSNENEADNAPTEVNEFVQKAQQAWTSPPQSSSSIPPPKINMNKLNKTGARESLLNSYKGVSKGGGTSIGNKGDATSIGKGMPPPPLPLKGAPISKGMPSPPKGMPSSSPLFSAGMPTGMPKKTIMAAKSYGKSGAKKWGKGIVGKGSGSMGSFSDSIGSKGSGSVSGGISPPPMRGAAKTGIPSPPPIMKGATTKTGIPPPPPIMKGAISKGTEQSSPQPPQQLPPKVAKSPSLFLKEFAKSNAPPFMPKQEGGTVNTNTNDGSSISSSSSGSDTDNDGSSNNHNEEAKYLTVAKEAWSKFFSSQVSQEDYVTMALDAWRDASMVKSHDADNAVVTSQKEDGAQSNTPSSGVKEENDVDTSSTDKKEGAIDAGASFFSGLKNSLFPGSNKSSSDAPATLTKGGDSSAISEKKNEEDVPYGLRAKSSSSDSVPPPLSSSSSAAPIEKSPPGKTGGNSDSLKNFINSVKKKGKSLGEKQITPPPLMKKGFTPPMKSLGEKQITPPPLMNKGVAPPMKSLGEKQTTPPLMKKGFTPPTKSLGEKQISLPPLSIKKGIAPPKQLDATAKKNWQGNRGGLSFLKSDKLSKEYKADKNYNPMNKAVTVEKIKGIVKGEETSISGGKELSSTPPPSLDKGGVKLGIQGKFAPKKLDSAAKKNWQGNRGGLSFLKSDKLSKEYKADQNYNPMNKAVTVEKIKGLKIGQTGKAKSDDDTEASSEDGEEELEESEDDEEEPEETTLFSTPELSSAPLDETAVEKDEASKIERWNKESFKPTLKGSESAPITNTDADVESELPEGKTTTISITDQGGTDVVNPGRAFIPAPKATEEKAGIGGGVKFAVKFGTTKLGMKGGMPLKGGSKTIGGSAKLLASKSGMLKGSIGAKKFGSPSIGGLLNKGNSKKIDFSLLKKGGISKGSKLPFQKSGGVAADVKSTPNMRGLKSKGAPLQPNNVLSPNDTSKSSLPSATGKANPPLSINKSSTPKLSMPPKTAQTKAVEAKKAASEGTPDKTNTSGGRSNTAAPPPATKLISDGMTAEEAEKIRMSRFKTGEEDGGEASTPLDKTASKQDTPTHITEDMTAEEAERVRKARLEIADSMKVKLETRKKTEEADIQTPKSTTSNDLNAVSKGLPLKGGMSLGEKQPTPSKTEMPFFAKKSLGDNAADAGGMKKGFPSAPMPMKGPMSKASDNDEASDESESSAPKGLPLKGGMG